LAATGRDQPRRGRASPARPQSSPPCPASELAGGVWLGRCAALLVLSAATGAARGENGGPGQAGRIGTAEGGRYLWWVANERCPALSWWAGRRCRPRRRGRLRHRLWPDSGLHAVIACDLFRAMTHRTGPGPNTGASSSCLLARGLHLSSVQARSRAAFTGQHCPLARRFAERSSAPAAGSQEGGNARVSCSRAFATSTGGKQASTPSRLRPAASIALSANARYSPSGLDSISTGL
jgi:hypothetical protein